MKRLLLALLITLSCLATAAVSGAAMSGPATAAIPPLAVHVVGNNLVDASGRAVRLRGVNRSGTEFACAQGWGFFDGPTDAASITRMLEWKINTVRVPLNESCWLGINNVSTQFGGANYRAAIQQWVTRLHEAGLLVILDLHWSAPGTTLATAQTEMPNADHSANFWRSVATTFKNDPAVIFDAFNEPHLIDWACWRNGCTTSEGWRAVGMQTLVDTIRSTGATQPIVLSGRHWGGDLSQWLVHVPMDPAGQLVAGAHIYNFSTCNSVSCWDASIAPVAAKFPVVTSELGSDDCARGFADTYLAWADSRGISSTPWTWNVWDCRQGPSLIADYNGTPTGFGIAVKERFQALASAERTAPAPTPTTSPPAPTTSPVPPPAPDPSPAEDLGAATSITLTNTTQHGTTGGRGTTSIPVRTGTGPLTISLSTNKAVPLTLTTKSAAGIVLGTASGLSPLRIDITVPGGTYDITVTGEMRTRFTLRAGYAGL